MNGQPGEDETADASGQVVPAMTEPAEEAEASGYDPGPDDAEPATEAAARACVGQGGRISAHFHLPEFACNHCHWPRANRALVRGLERLRGVYYPGGLPVVSGYRCAVHNAAIGGARGSQHLYGRAANIPPRVTVEKVAGLRLFGGLEYQPKISGRLCTHVDVRAGGSVTSPSIFAWG